MCYSFQPEISSKSCQAKVAYLRTHFKNMREAANAIKGMKLEKAFQYLEEVRQHTRCVPFLRFNRGIGRTAQAKQFGSQLTKGRWPEKSVKYLEELLKNLKSNGLSKGLNPETLVIRHVQVNQAPCIRRRTYRAHGRITAFKSSPCHVEVVACESFTDVPRALKSQTPVRKVRVQKKISQVHKINHQVLFLSIALRIILIFSIWKLVHNHYAFLK